MQTRHFDKKHRSQETVLISEDIHIRQILELGENNSLKSKKELIKNLSTLNSFVRDAVVELLVKSNDVDFTL